MRLGRFWKILGPISVSWLPDKNLRWEVEGVHDSAETKTRGGVSPSPPTHKCSREGSLSAPSAMYRIWLSASESVCRRGRGGTIPLVIAWIRFEFRNLSTRRHGSDAHTLPRDVPLVLTVSATGPVDRGRGSGWCRGGCYADPWGSVKWELIG